jgi:hypothetical protein
MVSQENKFLHLYANLLKSLEVGNDSSEFYSDQFGREFTNFIRSNPASLKHSFKKMIDKNYCHIETSSDGNFRIYSWDTWTGGTMHFYNVIFQWNANGKVFNKAIEYMEGDGGTFYSKVYTVQVNHRTFYLPIANSILSTKDCAQSISVYTIEGNQLIDTLPLFKTKKKVLNSIVVEYDFFSVADKPERPLELISYDDKLNIIYIPVVNDQMQVTNRNILYQLKGDYFEFIGIEAGKRK